MRILYIYISLIISVPAISQSLQDSLIAHYPLDGNTLDVTGNGHNGSSTTATLVKDRHNILNSAYKFDGVGDYIVVPHHSDLNFNYNEEFSISLWVKADFTQAHIVGSQKRNVILSKWEDNGPGNDDYPYSIRIYNGATTNQGKTSSFRFSQTCSYLPEVKSSTPINDMTWHHVILISGEGELKTYVDCELESSIIETNQCDLTNLDNLFIGRQGGSQNPSWFRGSIDEVRIYNRVLNTNDIDSLCERYVGISDNYFSEKNNFEVDPNPASSKLYIQTDEEEYKLLIFSATFQLVLQKPMNGNGDIDVSRLDNGIYFVRCVGDNLNTTKKIVVSN